MERRAGEPGEYSPECGPGLHDGRKLGGDPLGVYEVSMEETTMPALACSAWSARGGRGPIGRRVGTWERDTVWVGSLSWAVEALNLLIDDQRISTDLGEKAAKEPVIEAFSQILATKKLDGPSRTTD